MICIHTQWSSEAESEVQEEGRGGKWVRRAAGNSRSWGDGGRCHAQYLAGERELTWSVVMMQKASVTSLIEPFQAAATVCHCVTDTAAVMPTSPRLYQRSLVGWKRQEWRIRRADDKRKDGWTAAHSNVRLLWWLSAAWLCLHKLTNPVLIIPKNSNKHKCYCVHASIIHLVLLAGHWVSIMSANLTPATGKRAINEILWESSIKFEISSTSHQVCKPAYLVPVPSHNELRGLCKEGHPA